VDLSAGDPTTEASASEAVYALTNPLEEDAQLASVCEPQQFRNKRRKS